MFNWIFNQTPLHYFVQSFWRDEAFSYLLAKKSVLNIFYITAKDFNPPLYYLVLHYWMRIFGTSEIAIRSLSLIFFALCLYYLYLFLEEILKIKSNWIWVYLGIFALNPFLNYYAFEGRMYMMFATFALLSFYFFLKKEYKFYLISTILGLYTHYFMLLVLFSQAIFIFTSKLVKKEKSGKIKNLFLSGLFFLPWLVFLLSQHTFSGPQTWIKEIGLDSIPHLLGILYTGYEKDLGFYQYLLLPFSLFLYLILILGIKRSLKHKGKDDILKFLLIWTFLPIVSMIIFSLFIPLFLPRYFIFSCVGLLLLFVYFMENMEPNLKITFITVLLLFTLSYNYLQIKNRQKAPLRETISQIKMQAKPNDLLYVTNELNFHPAQYYFGENPVFVYGRNYDEIPSYVGKVLMPKDKFVNNLPIYPKKAFILNDDLQYNINASL